MKDRYVRQITATSRHSIEIGKNSFLGRKPSFTREAPHLARSILERLAASEWRTQALQAIAGEPAAIVTP
jgi:hypothetical protein